MSVYVQEYSDILVEELTHREEQIREKDMKNKFISTLLAVQSRIRSLQQGKARKNTASALTGKVLANVCYCTVCPSQLPFRHILFLAQSLVNESFQSCIQQITL